MFFFHEPCLLICTTKVFQSCICLLKHHPVHPCPPCLLSGRIHSIRCINNVRVDWPNLFFQQTFPPVCMLSFLVHILSCVYFILPFLFASILYKATIPLLSEQRTLVLLQALSCILSQTFDRIFVKRKLKNSISKYKQYNIANRKKNMCSV